MKNVFSMLLVSGQVMATETCTVAVVGNRADGTNGRASYGGITTSLATSGY